MKIYYAHAICTYGSKIEEKEFNHIKTNFPKFQIVDPGSYSDNPEKRRGKMEYCKKLVSGCNALVFSRLLGEITAGVALEINHALAENIPVYELKNGEIIKVTEPVQGISIEDTIALYDKWRVKFHN